MELEIESRGPENGDILLLGRFVRARRRPRLFTRSYWSARVRESMVCPVAVPVTLAR
jgi:hypothetical protein